MAVPRTPPGGRHHELSLAEARVRLTHLVRLTAVADQVTVIVDGGRPAAALVPVDAARSLAETQAAAARSAAHSEAVAAGWTQRLEAVRATLRAQHAAEVAELHRELREAWHLLDTLSPPGAHRPVDAARASRHTP